MIRVLCLVGFSVAGLCEAGRLPVTGKSANGRDAQPASQRPATENQIQLNGHTFTLPAGFTIELVAGPKLAERPVVAAFDGKGRLYVCDSSGSNEPTKVQAEKKPHRVMRLVDTDGDGVFDTSTVYVKNVMFPEGAMWLNGSLHVAAPPHIMKYTDTNDDGVADKEEVWFDGKTLTGCANDLHGPYHGPDGWIYWCKGAFAKQDYTLPNGNKFTTRASHIFRARPDGTGIEPVMTGGMDNPVDVVFTPGGERIFTTTFLQHPRDGRRDGLIHAIYGGIYGKDHDPIHEHPWTSPNLMPPMTHLGPAAPAGLHRYESDQFGTEYANNLFACQFNMRKVSRHVLVPTGSTFVTKDSDFVVSDNMDFHPTDVIEDADGSLLILDTGGWFKLCCPTSQLVKADVTGAIYRVRKAGAHKIDDSRGTKIDWAKATLQQVVELIADPRPVVRAKAADVLIGRGGNDWSHALHHLSSDATPRARLATLWLLSRTGNAEAAGWIRDCVFNPDEEVRVAAIHSISVRRDELAFANLLNTLRKVPLIDRPPTTPRVVRAAAEAIGRIGDSKAVGVILEALADEKNDRALDHSLTYALIEIGDAKATAAGLKHVSPQVRRACLAALENIPDSNLDAKAVIAELSATDAALRETAWWIVGRHPQWGVQMADYLRDRVKKLGSLSTGEADEFAARLAPLLKNPEVRDVVGDALLVNEDPGPSPALLRAMARSGLKALPDEWRTGVRIALNSTSADGVRDALGVLRSVPPSAAQHAKILDEVKEYRDQRNRPLLPELAYALRATAPAGTPLPDDAARTAIRDTNRNAPGPLRSAAADLLTRTVLSADSLVSLAGVLPGVSPLELPKLLGAFARSTDAKVGLVLVKALSDPTVRSVVRAETVKPILDKYPKPVRDEAEKLYALLAEATKGECEKLDKLLTSLEPGDVRRGQAVFNGAKGQCVACHKIGYVGGLVGPDLTRIGGIRTERDLLEAIVFPNASFVRSFEPVRVVTADGRTLNGVLKKDAPDEIVLAVAADKEERLARADIESINPSSVSVMPAGLDQQLTTRELADLVAFLRACK